MILEGKYIEDCLCNKYIEINRNNAEYVLKIIYSKGYKWTSALYNINQTMNYYKLTVCKYIKLYDDGIFTLANTINDVNYLKKFEEFNVNILMREDKLKRILKSK